MEVTYESTELWAHPMLQLLCKRASFVEKPKIILSLFVVITTTYLLFLFSIVFGYHKSCKCLVITFNQTKILVLCKYGFLLAGEDYFHYCRQWPFVKYFQKVISLAFIFHQFLTIRYNRKNFMRSMGFELRFTEKKNRALSRRPLYS